MATTSQLRAAGVTTETVRWHTGRTWRVVLPRVVVLTQDAPTGRQRTIGALLWAGPKPYVTAANAAEHHGIRSAARHDGLVEMLTPHPHATRNKGYASVRRTELEDHDIRTIGPIRVASPAHAAVTAAVKARSESLREAILIEAVQRDIWFDDVALAVMVHSHEFHSQGEQWVDTVERDGDLTAEQVVVLGVTPTSLRRRPEEVLERVEKCYRTAAARPRPDVVIDHEALRATRDRATDLPASATERATHRDLG